MAEFAKVLSTDFEIGHERVTSDQIEENNLRASM